MNSSQRFDPYISWLGIRQTDRPLNHYQLLGIDELEEDLRVIEAAAERQVDHVQRYQYGPYERHALQLLAELEEARTCLLHAASKSAYDAQLIRQATSGSKVASSPGASVYAERRATFSAFRAQELAEKPFIEFVVISGPHAGERFRYYEPCQLTVGRGSQCDLRFQKDEHFSRKHFQLTLDPPYCLAEDLQSRTGTYVHGRKVNRADLNDGEIVAGGKTKIRVHCVDPTQSEQPKQSKPAKPAEPNKRKTMVEANSHAETLSGLQKTEPSVPPVEEPERTREPIGPPTDISPPSDWPPGFGSPDEEEVSSERPGLISEEPSEFPSDLPLGILAATQPGEGPFDSEEPVDSELSDLFDSPGVLEEPSAPPGSAGVPGPLDPQPDDPRAMEEIPNLPTEITGPAGPRETPAGLPGPAESDPALQLPEELEALFPSSQPQPQSPPAVKPSPAESQPPDLPQAKQSPPPELAKAPVQHQSPEKAPAEKEAKLPSIPGYRIFDRLSKTATTEVFHAEQLSSQREVAIKLLKPNPEADQASKHLFVREASLISQLRHPNLMRIYELGMFSGRFYLTTEYIPTVEFPGMYRESPHFLWGVLQLATKLLEVLEYAHSHGMLHRDIKPANILIGQNENGLFCKVADFGLMRSFEEAGLSLHPLTSDVWGSMVFMAPEQLRQNRGGFPQTDLYSLAVTIYHFLSGHIPYEIDEPRDAIWAILDQPPIPIRQFNPDLPEMLEQLLAYALAKEPDQRFQTAEEMKQAFLHVIQHL